MNLAIIYVIVFTNLPGANELKAPDILLLQVSYRVAWQMWLLF